MRTIVADRHRDRGTEANVKDRGPNSEVHTLTHTHTHTHSHIHTHRHKLTETHTTCTHTHKQIN